jgi:outer membrane protein TolC
VPIGDAVVGAASRASDGTSGDSEITRQSGGTSESSSGTNLNQVSARFSVSQLIDITGIVRAAEHFGDLQKAFSRLELARLRQQTAFNVRNAYYNLLRAQAFVTVDESAVADSQELLRVTQAQKNAGVASEYDVLRAQTQLDNNVQALISARNQVALSKNAFANTLGIDPSTPIEPQEQPVPPMPALTEEPLIQQAFNQRPEFLEANVNLLKAQTNIRLSRRNLEPYLNAGINGNYNATPSAFAADKATGNIGLTLTVPLYDGGATKAAVDQARSDERTAQVQRDQFIRGIKAEVQQSILAVQDASQRVQAISLTVTEAKEALRLAGVRFRAGVGTQLDVNDAQTALVQAQTNQVNAQYDYLGSLARLSLAVGTPE